MSEATILAALSAERAMAHVRHIATEIPSRLAGSPNGRRMAEYSQAALAEAGVAARIEEMPGPVSFPEPAQFRVTAPREIAIAANTMGHSLETLAEGIAGELVDVGSGAEADYAGKAVAGRITLAELSYAPARQEKQRIAAVHGALAQVMLNWGQEDSDALPMGSLKQAWGTPTPEAFATEMPTIPCIGISRKAGLELKRMLADGPVRVWLRTTVDNPWRPVQITVGEVASGTDDFVLVGGHQDSWPGEAATDNAAGSACLLELARVFQANRQHLRRGLVLGFWAGHETGTMIGSSWFADRNWERLRRNAVAYLQIDQPGCAGSSVWRTFSHGELRAFHQEVERRIVPDLPQTVQRLTKIGDSSFFGAGIPMLWGDTTFDAATLQATAGAGFGWWHHSLANTLDKVDQALLGRHLQVYGAWLWALCTLPVLPFDFREVARQIEGRLQELLPAGAGIGLGEALERARAFGAAAERLRTGASHWQEVHAREGAAADGSADQLNHCMKRLSRLLVPLVSTLAGRYGQDPYGSTPQATTLPRLFEVPRLAELPEGPERWMLETKLVRARNQVVDALGEATGLIDDTLARLP